MAAVKITRVRRPGMVECEQCSEISPNATRERARTHAARRGHTVHYIVEDDTVYRPREAQEAA